MAREFASLFELIKNPSCSTTQTCESCRIKLTVFKRKKNCGECEKIHCMQCLVRCPNRILQCKNCNILTTRPPIRAELMTLKVKDLQQYLTSHHVSTFGCVEKEDLVNVFLRHASNPSFSGNRNAPSQNHQQTSGRGSPPPKYVPSALSASATTHSSSAAPATHSIPSPSRNIRNSPDGSSGTDTSFEFLHRSNSELSLAGISSTSSSPDPSTPPSSTHSSEGERNCPPQAQTPDHIDEQPTSTEPASLSSPERQASGPSENSGENLESNSTLLTTASVFNQSGSQTNTANSSPILVRINIERITNEEEFDAFTVKQLKDILVRHRVNYRGDVEKGELVERCKRLYKDYCSSRADISKLNMDELCKICMDAPVECVMLECGHMATCTDCGRQLNECPICRQFVVRIVRTFKA